MVTAWVSIGSNVARRRHITAALRALQRRFGPLRVSSVYETEAVGFDGDPFFNLVVSFVTDEPPRALNDFFKALEAAHGRRRGGERFAPRSLDLDLLLYGDLVVDEEGLKLPRDDILDYAFVLEPLAELAPAQRYPGRAESFSQLWREFRRRHGGASRRVDWQPLAAAGNATE